MAHQNHLDALSQDVISKIVGMTLGRTSDVPLETATLAAVRLTCKALSLAGFDYITELRVRDSTEPRDVKHIIQHSNRLKTLDASLGNSNKSVPALLQELGKHAWERMHLEGAARNAWVWASSTRTLTGLSTNNWGRAYRSDAQEEAWRKAEKSGDYTYFESIAGFPMLGASLADCMSLNEVELRIDPKNLGDDIRFVPFRLWRLNSVKVLTVRQGGDGETDDSESLAPRECDALDTEYALSLHQLAPIGPDAECDLGLHLLSVAFPRVEHVKFPNWFAPLGLFAELSPFDMQPMQPDGPWNSVRTLELGIEGLPYTWDANRIGTNGIVDLLQPANWPNVQTLIIWGTFISTMCLNPFWHEYIKLIAPGTHLRHLATLVIEHPVAQLHPDSEAEPDWAEGYNILCRMQDEKAWKDFLELEELREGGWVGRRENLSNGATSLLSLSRDNVRSPKPATDGRGEYDLQDAQREITDSDEEHQNTYHRCGNMY